ncbi:hypothetical protein [Burkholderia glumae]|uniref:hypothetical protein n=1 Tax=Burkholderia glumae TaxID=337 RepID=UPI0021507619|nr:hypothetical protein [Burkholderia glumae]
MITLGIDPGLSGAICFMDQDGLAGIFDLPTMVKPEAGPKTLIKREIDVCALRDLLREHIPADESVLCAIEHVSSLGADVRGEQAKMSLAATKASITAVLRLMRIDVHRVAPQTWKRFYGLSSDKGAALAIARQFWPHYMALKRAKDHNRAEAALIARWAQRNLT